MRSGGRPSGALAAALLLAALAGCSGEGTPKAEPAQATSSAQASARSGSASADMPADAADELPVALTLEQVGATTIEATPFPDFALAVGKVVWVSGAGRGLVGYDGATGRPIGEARVSDVVAAMDAYDGTLWLVETKYGTSRLVGVDGRTGQVRGRTRLPAPVAEESSVAAGPRGVFVLLVDGRVASVAGPGRKVRTFDAPVGATALRYGFGSLWVPVDDGVLHRVDPATGRTAGRTPVGRGARFLTVGHGAVWVMNQADGTVSRVDPRTGQADPPITVQPYPIEGGDIASGPHGVWIRAGAAAASLLDPRTGAVTARVGGDVGSGSIAETAGNLWITAHDHLVIHRVPWPPSS
ncbi:MAG: hypothetical protein ACTHKG_07890 [Nocardioides sp.]